MSNWQDRAECARLRLPTELFFPERGEPIDPRVIHACAACPVSRECLDAAMACEPSPGGHGRSGIWGGYTGYSRTLLAAGRKMSPIYSVERGMRNRAKARKAA